ncbi:MAG: restriction endonuclease subunit S [[Ruminococcus] gnavus]|nr:restriction endonuclease subunit S [Mediterraneibacter gnavus]
MALAAYGQEEISLQEKMHQIIDVSKDIYDVASFIEENAAEFLMIDEAKAIKHAVQYGDILFTQSSENVEEVGLTSVWLHKETPFLNSFCMALRPKNLDQYVPEYMGYVMRSSEIRKQISSQGQGISRINLAASRIKNVEIPIPCKEEQYKISECLIGIDSVISLKIEKLNIWEKIRQGLLQQMFV